MARGRQADHSRGSVRRRRDLWMLISLMSTRTTMGSNLCRVTFRSMALSRLNDATREDEALSVAARSIAASGFTRTFSLMAQRRCLELFRFEKTHFDRVVRAIGWPEDKLKTTRGGYRVTPLLVTCVILNRLASTSSWADVELLFGKYRSQLSKIFWEGIENFLDRRSALLMGEISKTFIADRAATYAGAVSRKSPTFNSCIGFIDGTLIRISRPVGHGMVQRSVYNGHKRAHGLKFQAVSLLDGLCLHAFGPVEGRRHDITMYRRSGIESQLQQTFLVEGEQYFLYGDAAYTRHPWMLTPQQGAYLSNEDNQMNKDRAVSRTMVEWMFMDVKRYWPRVYHKSSLRVCQAPVGKMYIAAMLLTNIRNCIYPNIISQFFDINPPSLEEYLAHQ